MKNTKRMKAEGEEEIQTIIEDSDDEDTEDITTDLVNKVIWSIDSICYVSRAPTQIKSHLSQPICGSDLRAAAG